jgi:hypothetical protein
MSNLLQNIKLGSTQLAQYELAPNSIINLNIEAHYELVQEVKKYIYSITEDNSANLTDANAIEFFKLCNRLSINYMLLMDLNDGNRSFMLHKPKSTPIVLSNIDKSRLIKCHIFGDINIKFEDAALDILIRNWENSSYQEHCEIFYSNKTNESIWLYTKDESIPTEFVQISNEWNELNKIHECSYNLSLLFVTGPKALYDYDISNNSLLKCAHVTKINNIISKINYDIIIMRNSIRQIASHEKMQMELDSCMDVKSYLAMHDYDLRCVYTDDYSGQYINEMITIINNIEKGKDWLLNQYESLYANNDDPILKQILNTPEFAIHSGTSGVWVINTTKSYFEKGPEKFAYDCLQYQKFRVHMNGDQMI